MVVSSLIAAILQVGVAAFFFFGESFGDRKTRVAELLRSHRPQEALALARTLNREVPDDLPVYAMLADAAFSLGLYKEAEKATQTILDLRPGHPLGLVRGARLRLLYGDHEGAQQFVQMALQRIPASEASARAEALALLGHVQLRMGRRVQAEASFRDALAVQPAYADALLGLAKGPLRSSDCEAIGARCWFALGDVKRLEAAARNESRLDLLALALSEMPDRRAEAVTLAREAVAGAPTVEARHALAWALFRAGKFDEALAEVERSLAEGTRDTNLLEHAATIAEAAARKDLAAKWRRMAARLTPDE